MWLRNLLFIGVILGGLSALGLNLFPRPLAPSKTARQALPTPDTDFSAVVTKVNETFRQQWAELALQPAPRAADLTIIRRLALALTGSIPSLQDIRQLE